MKISRNPQEVSLTVRTKNSSTTNNQLRSALRRTWNLCKHITAREVFCCCIFGGKPLLKWTSISTGLFLSCVVYPAQVHPTTVWRAHIGKVCMFVTLIWKHHCALLQTKNLTHADFSHHTGKHLQYNLFNQIISDIFYESCRQLITRYTKLARLIWSFYLSFCM